MIVETFLFLLNALLLNGRLKYSSPKLYAGKPDTNGEPSETSEKPEDLKPKMRRTYREKVLGVWKIIYVTQPRFAVLNLSSYFSSFLANIRICKEHWPLLVHFMKETYDIAPRGVVLYLTHNLWDSLQGSLSMYFSSRILDLVSLSLYFFLSLLMLSRYFLPQIGDRLQGKEISQAEIAKVVVLKIITSLISNALLQFV